MKSCFPHRLALLVLTMTAAFIARAEPLALAVSPACRIGTGDTPVGPAAAFRTNYDPDDWSGSLQAFRIDAGIATPSWNSADGLDAAGFRPASRTVLSHDGKSGVAMRWEQLSPDQRGRLAGADGETPGRQRLDFIRGEHGAEMGNGGPLRSRTHKSGAPFRQGAIVDSRPWLTARPVTRHAYEGFAAFRNDSVVATRPTMVWVGGNDGMQHGFDADTGAERLAYVPRGILTGLRLSTQPGWQGQLLVDGSPFTGDADIHATRGASRWATVLVGSPGAGARGYFVLDVSRPAGFAESAARATVLLDTTADTDPDLGHISGEPSSDAYGAGQIARLNDDRWAVLLGNGANSASEMPVLLLQYLDGGRELARIAPTCPAAPASCPWRGGNGLSTPTLIDLDTDGRADIAYAGDLHGNLWKFDLRQGKPANWSVSFGGKPLFSARDADGGRQPIVAAPGWLPHPAGGVMLAVGTGRSQGIDDCADTHVQTLYGLHDNTVVNLYQDLGVKTMTFGGGTPINSPADTGRPASLVAQSQLPDAVTADGHTFYRTTANTAPASATPSRGWFFDLPAPGERLLRQPRVFSGQKMLFDSAAPGQDYLSVLNLITGQPSASAVFTALANLAQDPNSGVSAEQANNATRVAVPAGSFIARGTGKELLLVSPGRQPIRLAKGRTGGKRAGWRQLQ